MKLVSGVSLLLLMLTAEFAPSDDQPWRPPPSSTADDPASTEQTSAIALSASASTSSTTEAPPVAPRNTSVRLADDVEEEASDYADDEMYEAASGRDWLPPESDSVTVASSTGTNGGDGDGNDDGPSPFPVAVNWIPWLPVWCREQWPFEDTLNVNRETLLRAFTEALIEYSVGIANYWAQTAELADTGEEASTEEQRTHFVTTAIDHAQTLLHLYKWMYHKLKTSRPDGDHAPESLYRFLDAVGQQTDWVESICNWSPAMRWTCFAGESEILQNFFWVMDRQQIWMRIFHRWAATQYDLTAGLRRPPRLWLPLDEDTLPFCVSHFCTTNQTTGDNGSAVETVGNGVCTNEMVTLPDSHEYFGDLSSVRAARPNSRPVTDYVSRDKPHNQKLLPTCELESITRRGQLTGRLMGTERTPVRDRENEMSLRGGEDESEAARAPPRNGMDGYDGVEDLNPDESFYEDGQHMLQSEEGMRETMEVDELWEEHVQDSRTQLIGADRGNLRSCSATPVLLELGPGFDPHSVTYVTCDERDLVCEPPRKCSPVRSAVAVEMARWATLPDVPSTYTSVWEMPNGNLLVSLWVATSCKCREAFD